MSDDPGRAIAAADSAPSLEGVARTRPWVQLTEASASQQDAGDALETSDDYGRVPVLVRVRRVPAIRIEALLVAVLLVASGVIAPVSVELRALFIAAAIVAVLAGELDGGWAMDWRRRLFFFLIKLQARWPLVPRISFGEPGVEGEVPGTRAESCGKE